MKVLQILIKPKMNNIANVFIEPLLSFFILRLLYQGGESSELFVLGTPRLSFFKRDLSEA